MTLGNSILSSIPLYYISLLLMPFKVSSQMERILRSIFGKDIMVASSLISSMACSLKSQIDGGLGFGGLTTQNQALLAKWGWKLMFDSNSLWCKVVRSIHGNGINNWHTSGRFGKSLRSPWIHISRIWLQFESVAIFKLGSGRR